MSGEDRERWEQMLNDPLDGQTQVTDRQIEQEGADFLATLQMHQGMSHG